MHNELPDRFFNDFEYGMEYILIPGGTYAIGELKKQVKVEPFYMAKFTVTNKHYQKFANSTRRAKSLFLNNKKFNGDAQPALIATWDDATAYCEWLGRNSPKEFRLPTEEEWEWAAGGGVRMYPWGNGQPDHSRANFGGIRDGTTPLGNYPNGATPEGLMDMAGNVMEWTDSFHQPENEFQVVREGSWLCRPKDLRCSYRDDDPGLLPWNSLGFRVACSVP